MLDPQGKYHDNQSPRRRVLTLVLGIPAGIVLLALFLGPVCAVAALAVGRNQSVARQFDPVTAIHAAGIIMAIYLVFWLIPVIVLWARAGRKDPSDRKSGALSSINASLAVVGGAVCWGLAAYHGTEASVPHWSSWSVPIYLTTCVGAFFAITIFVVHRSTPIPTEPGSGTQQVAATERRFNRIQDRIQQLPADQRAAIHHDIEAAVRDLLQQNMISADESQRALDAELGRLALHMAQGD